MTGIINIGTSSLQTYQQMIATISHNISNATNEDYTRQTTHLTTQAPQRLGTSFIGRGSKFAGVTRAYHGNTVNNLRDTTTVLEQTKTLHTTLSKLDTILSDSHTGLFTNIDRFYASMDLVTAHPNDMAARNQMQTDAELLVMGFNRLGQTLDDMRVDAANDINLVVKDINSLVDQIADTNRQILGTSTPSPDLLDKRDALVLELSKQVDIEVFTRQDNMINVSIGGSQSVVVGTEAVKISSTQRSTDPVKKDINIILNGNEINMTSSITGGRLAALLEVQDEVIDQVKGDLGLVSLGLAGSFNEQHQQGMDLDGNTRTNFFRDINNLRDQQGRAISSIDNTGDAQLRVYIDDVASLKNHQYQVIANPTDFTLINLTTGAQVNSGAFPVSMDGFDIELDSGSISAGDTFIIRPLSSAANDIQLHVTEPRQMALATPVRVGRSTQNLGDANISFAGISDIQNSFFDTPGQLAPPLRVEFLSETSFQIVNSNTNGVLEGPMTYDPSQANALFPTPGGYDPGIEVNISGAAKAGDSFNIEYNSEGTNDNRNAQLLRATQQLGSLANDLTPQSQYTQILSNVGSMTNQMGVSTETNQILLNQIEAQKESFSGVNLEEEAAHLLEIQQAYQASAQVVTVGLQLFEVILSSLR